MDNKWKQDPRVKGMNPQKLKYLEELAASINTTPKNQLMTVFATMSLEANKKGIQFTDQETDLLTTILSENMSPADRKRMDTLRLLSRKLAK